MTAQLALTIVFAALSLVAIVLETRRILRARSYRRSKESAERYFAEIERGFEGNRPGAASGDFGP